MSHKNPRITLAVLSSCVLAAILSITPPESAGAKPRQSPYVSREMPAGARQYYADLWGVDQLAVKRTESGQLVRFTYRVVDAKKAAPLNDRSLTASLVDEKAKVILQVPVMEKVGPLRQSTPAENGKTYWMVFSNKGDLVKAGHKVSVTIGPVRLDGLFVQ